MLRSTIDDRRSNAATQQRSSLLYLRLAQRGVFKHDDAMGSRRYRLLPSHHASAASAHGTPSLRGSPHSGSACDGLSAGAPRGTVLVPRTSYLVELILLL